jgi:hypothetical protein
MHFMLCVRVRESYMCAGIGCCPTSPAKLRERDAGHIPADRSHYAYRPQKVVLDVHHCKAICADCITLHGNMCRLYNTAAMAAAEATEATAVVAAVAVSN